ncbi:MAG TPA: acyltransferase [Falsiroseomonas sp.]|nr:acyltransferase [Falsiroseomonas sp.]
MKEGKILRGLIRVAMPSFAASAYYFFKYRATISPKSEVDINSNVVFGPGCVIGSFSKVKATEGPLVMGPRGGIANFCFISAGRKGITIGENFICGPNVNIVGQHYIYSEKNRHLEDQGIQSRGIKIGSNVWIGAGCTITDGAVIGNNTIIVANSLVNRKYPDDVILQGAPAKVILKR